VVRSPARYVSGQVRAASTLRPTIEEDARPYHHVTIEFLRPAMKHHSISLLLSMISLQVLVPQKQKILWIHPTKSPFRVEILRCSPNPCLHRELPPNRYQLIYRVIMLDPRPESLFYCASRFACTIILPVISRLEMLPSPTLTRPSAS
jgi:hypothetical protein